MKKTIHTIDKKLFTISATIEEREDDSTLWCPVLSTLTITRHRKDTWQDIVLFQRQKVDEDFDEEKVKQLTELLPYFI